MGLKKGIKGVISFLTIIPAGGEYTPAADYVFIFPLIGALIGILAGAFALLFFHILPKLLAGSLILGFILLITGLHHTDGLVDFGDGLMAGGGPKKKIQAMHDINVGVGGTILGFFVVLITLFAISNLGKGIMGGLIVSEISAKLSMIIGAWVGRPAHRGMGIKFIKAMKGFSGSIRLLLALFFSLGLAFLILGLWGFVLLVGGAITAIVLVLVSNYMFNGLTGDVFGAMNDLSRMTALVILCR